MASSSGPTFTPRQQQSIAVYGEKIKLRTRGKQREIASRKRAKVNAETVRNQQRSAEIAQRSAARQADIDARTQAAVKKKQSLVAIQQQQKDAARKAAQGNPAQRIAGGTSSAVGSGAEQVSRHSANPVMMIIFFIIGGSLFYRLVHQSDKTSGFLSGLGTSLGKLSQTTPLFVKEPPK